MSIRYMNEEFNRKVWAMAIIHQEYLKSWDRIRITVGESIHRREEKGMKGREEEEKKLRKRNKKRKTDPGHSTL